MVRSTLASAPPHTTTIHEPDSSAMTMVVELASRVELGVDTYLISIVEKEAFFGLVDCRL